MVRGSEKKLSSANKGMKEFEALIQFFNLENEWIMKKKKAKNKKNLPHAFFSLPYNFLVPGRQPIVKIRREDEDSLSLLDRNELVDNIPAIQREIF